MPDHPVSTLPLSRESMAEVARRSLDHALKRGASDAEVEVSAAVGQSVTVRRGDLAAVHSELARKAAEPRNGIEPRIGARLIHRQYVHEIEMA